MFWHNEIDWASIIWEWTKKKGFLFAYGNIWNSKGAFYDKTNDLLRQVCFNIDLSDISLSSITSACI